MSVKENVMGHKKYKRVPPDGGFGYFIIISCVINFSTMTAFVGCFGMIFNDFIKDMGMSSTSVNLVVGANAMCVAISAFLTNSLLKLMSMRKLAFISAVTFDLGVLGTVFAKSGTSFFFSQGVLQGLGLGILFNLTSTILNEYFVTKRLFAISLVQTITALCAMLAPMFVKWCLEAYGFRGTLLIITGLSLQNFVSTILMQPVAWHMKKIEIIDKDELQLLLAEEKKEKKAKEANNHEVPTIKLTDIESPALGVTDSENVYDFTLKPKKKSLLRRIVENIIDIEVCKQLLVSCVSHGPALCNFADGAYLLILPQALYSKGWNQYNVALALSYFAFGDLAARALLMFTSKWILKLGSHEIYVIGVAVAFLSRFAMMWTQNTILIFIYLSLTGAAHCTICVLIPLVISDVVSADKFTSAMGMVVMMLGVTYIILGPAIGAIRDITNSYAVAFHILTSCYAIVLLFWSIELLYKRNEHKRVQREIALKSSRLNKQ